VFYRSRLDLSLRSWHVFDAVARLRPIRNEAEYERTLSMMNALLDVVGDDEYLDLASLLGFELGQCDQMTKSV